MGVGLIARATDSGLGHLSVEFYQNFNPDKVLCIVGADNRYEDHIEWYPMATFAAYRELRHVDFDRFLEDLDVVFSYETFYEERLLAAANRGGVRTVLMGMPELTRRFGHHGWIGDPDEYVWPTSWRFKTDPPEHSDRVLPVPTTRALDPVPATVGPLRVLHVAGARAFGDRNGTDLFASALIRVVEPIDVRICTNGIADERLNHLDHLVKTSVTIEHGASDRWTMYEDRDVLVLPRRYGGLSLIAHEAASMGLAVLMPDCSPNHEYPAQLMRCAPGPSVNLPVGRVRTFRSPPGEIARAIDTLARNRDLLQTAKEASAAWARERSWNRLSDDYRKVLGCLERT